MTDAATRDPDSGCVVQHRGVHSGYLRRRQRHIAPAEDRRSRPTWSRAGHPPQATDAERLGAHGAEFGTLRRPPTRSWWNLTR
jgi:hypothetical protein